MDIRMIATDMDGTLLDAQGQFDNNRFEKILDQLEERHIKFVVATGNEIGRTGRFGIFCWQRTRLSFGCESS